MSDSQQSSPPTCHSFLVRIWQPHAASGWCFQLRSVDGEQRMMFDDPVELIRFMMEGVGGEISAETPISLTPIQLLSKSS